MPLQLNTRDDLGYVFQPLPSHILRFKVRAPHDAHILLSDVVNPSKEANNNFVEILIGGWENQASAIRCQDSKPDKIHHATPNILNNYEFRGFWVNYTGGVIAVGKDNEVEPFLTWPDSSQPLNFNFKYFGVHTKHGASGEWIIYDDDVMWVPGRVGVFPVGAVMGGFHNEVLIVGRAQYGGAVVPGSVRVSQGLCYIDWGSTEYHMSEYEVLTGPHLQWEWNQEGVVPANAVEGGKTENGETLYIGRAQFQDATIIGKVQPSHKLCYVTYSGQEVAFPKYEILVHK